MLGPHASLEDLMEKATQQEADQQDQQTQQTPQQVQGDENLTQQAALRKPSGNGVSKAIAVRIPLPAEASDRVRRSARVAGKPPTVDVAAATTCAFPNSPALQQNIQPLTDQYRPHHVDAQDALAFASIKMKDRYDSKHKAMFFDVGDFVHLRLHRGYQMAGVLSRKLGQQFAGPFEVVERIGRLAYRLKLPATMKIHDVVSVAHLEPATDPTKDPYGRVSAVPPPIIVDNHEEYEIERLVKKRLRRYGRAKLATTQYLVRWKGCGPQDDEWISEPQLANAPDLIKEYEENFGPKAGISTHHVTVTPIRPQTARKQRIWHAHLLDSFDDQATIS